MRVWKKRIHDATIFFLGIIFATCVTVLAETCSTTLSSGNVTYGNTTAEAEVTSLLTQAGNINNRVSSLEDAGNPFSKKSLELNPTGALSNFGGFIDFHYAGSSDDYTSRIIEGPSGVLQFNAQNGVAVNGKYLNKTENVNCQLNSTTVASGRIACVVKNGIAMVEVLNLKLKAAGNSQTIATGLPVSALQVTSPVAGSNAAKTAQIIGVGGDVAWINENNSTLFMHAGSTYGELHYFSLTYIVAD